MGHVGSVHRRLRPARGARGLLLAHGLLMEWATETELGTAYGLAVGAGCLLGALVALFNSWRA